MLNELSAHQIAERARRIRLVVSDVDGVLTDAGIYYSARGEELKRFSVRDGMGVELLRQANIETMFLTREDSDIVRRRAEKLALREVHLGVRDKRQFLMDWLYDSSVALDGIAYIGDDVNDLPVMEFVAEAGLTAAPRDAVSSVRSMVHFLSAARGGFGAFREFGDFIIELRKEEDADE